MERLKHEPVKGTNRSLISDGIFSLLIKLPYGSDMIALYTFYRNKVIKDKTDNVYANNTYCMRGLKWGNRKFNRTKKLLILTGLISHINKKRNINTGIFGKSYIKVNYEPQDYQMILMAINRFLCKNDESQTPYLPPVVSGGISQTPYLPPVVSFPVVSLCTTSALRSTISTGKKEEKNTTALESGCKEEEEGNEFTKKEWDEAFIEIKEKTFKKINEPPKFIVNNRIKYRRIAPMLYKCFQKDEEGNDDSENYDQLDEDYIIQHQKENNWCEPPIQPIKKQHVLKPTPKKLNCPHSLIFGTDFDSNDYCELHCVFYDECGTYNHYINYPNQFEPIPKE